MNVRSVVSNRNSKRSVARTVMTTMNAARPTTFGKIDSIKQICLYYLDIES
jgi:hypothetical protein